MGFFGEPEPATDAPPEPLKADERHTLGHVIEQRLAGLCNTVGRNFKPGQAPVNLFNLSMSGKYKNQQRAVKLILENKRVALAQGVGSGKSVISLGAFAELHAQGKVKKGLFCVPSIVQEQMHAEALRFLQADRFKWSSGTGATRDERIAALKDPENHFSITTHQSLRDDLLYLGAQHAGMTEAALARHIDTQTPAQRQAWMKDLLDKEGINADYLMVDEGHNLLNREGKENSAMANVLDALSANASHYVNATADPIKNDVSEAFSLLEKMNPGKYNNRAEFMRRYGPDTRAAKDGLRRELLQHLYPGRIDPGVAAKKIEQRLDLNPEQHQAIADLDSAAGQIKLARIQGKAHVEAAKKLAPQLFKDAPEDQHEAIAKEVAKSAGVLKNAAVKAVIDRHPGGAKQQAVHQIIADRKGKPGVIFCHSLDAVAQLTEQLKAKGHRVVSMTGADNAQAKAQKKAQFSPDGGAEASADIMVTSDAGAVGMNAQRGQWLVQYDTPDTAMCSFQRNGRIHRLGQQNNVELIDLIANHPSEDAARKRLASKTELREIITSPYDHLDDTGLAHHLQQRRAERLDNQGGLF
jgi:superfamily II DNA or RNA helicase